MGIGAIPDAVLSKLNNHKNLGIHSEMFSDGILPLLEKGNITNACKSMHFGKVIGGFAVGSQKLYDWMDDNPLVRQPAPADSISLALLLTLVAALASQLNMMDIQHVNDVSIIKRQHRMTAINSCIEVSRPRLLPTPAPRSPHHPSFLASDRPHRPGGLRLHRRAHLQWRRRAGGLPSRRR